MAETPVCQLLRHALLCEQRAGCGRQERRIHVGPVGHGAANGSSSAVPLEHERFRQGRQHCKVWLRMVAKRGTHRNVGSARPNHNVAIVLLPPMKLCFRH